MLKVTTYNWYTEKEDIINNISKVACGNTHYFLYRNGELITMLPIAYYKVTVESE